MKASEMTNEELAKELMSRVPLDSDRHDDIREAAARLRKRIEFTPEMATEMCRRESDLLAKLKVAEDALVKLQDRLVSSVHDGTIDPHAALEIAERALATIREEGGAK